MFSSFQRRRVNILWASAAPERSSGSTADEIGATQVTHAASCSYSHKSQGLDQWPVSRRRTAATQHNTNQFSLNLRGKRGGIWIRCSWFCKVIIQRIDLSGAQKGEMQSKHASHTMALKYQEQCSYSFTLHRNVILQRALLNVIWYIIIVRASTALISLCWGAQVCCRSHRGKLAHLLLELNKKLQMS